MPLVLGIDLGTTTITSIALDTATGQQTACHSVLTPPPLPRPEGPEAGRREWDVAGLTARASACLQTLTASIGVRGASLAGLGITGQQHGTVVLGPDLQPLGPFINWQDQRGEERGPEGRTWTQTAVARVGEAARERTGCRLATGYLALTLFWLREHGLLPEGALACFLMDHFAALLTGRRPVTDPTCAASSGALHLPRGDWDDDILAALGLPRSLFPEVRPSGEFLGEVRPEMAQASGLPAGLPVFVGIGDNQASFLGSVARPEETVLVNVGTGGQVARWSPQPVQAPSLEARPFPGEGFLVVAAGLSGGAMYACLERFFWSVGHDLFGLRPADPLYDVLNDLAAGIPAGAGGVRCEPFFAGTRGQPELRGGFSGLSLDNFTPAHLTRALLEGMARTCGEGARALADLLGSPPKRLVGSGNGIRANRLLARLIAAELGLPLHVPTHTEEAARGAALVAAVGAGLLADFRSAGSWIDYQDPLFPEG
jgi:sugar (pentulose or hexulose) kinase